MWLPKWSTDSNVADTQVRNMYLIIYAAFGVGQGWYIQKFQLILYIYCISFFNIFSLILSDAIPRFGFLDAAKNIHNCLLNGIIHAPL